MPLSNKKQNKTSFQKSFKLKVSEKIPMMGVFLEYYPLEKINDLAEIMSAITRLDIQMAIVEPEKTLLKSIIEKNIQNKENLKFVPQDVTERLLEACDVALFLANNHFQSIPVHTAMESNVVPIALEGLINELKNYDPLQEKGNSFLYKKFNKWDIFESIVRARENFRFSYDWKNIMRAEKDEL